MFNVVMIKYVYFCLKKFLYDPINPTQIILEDYQNFRLSKNTTFLELKKAACIFWCIDNDSDYALTENTEILIYDEEISIDYYLRNYSVSINIFKLVNITFIKTRNTLSSAQTQSIREGNRFLLSEDKRAEEELGFMNHDNNIKLIKQETKGFFQDYPGLKIYMLNEKEAKLFNPQTALQKQTSMGNSFLMLLILITLFVFTIMFFFQVRDISRVNTNRKFMIKLLEPPELKTLDDVKDYMIEYVGKVLLKTDSSFLNNSKLYNEIPNYIDTLSPTQKEAAIITNMQKNYLFHSISSIHLIIHNVKTYNKTQASLMDSEVGNDTLRYNTIYSSDVALHYSENLYKIYQETKMEGLKNFSTYQSSEQAKVYLNINGKAGFYDGSGFHGDISGKMDFFAYKNFINKYFPSSDEENNLGKTFIIDKSTRAMILLFNLYFPSSGNWMNVAIPIEFLPTGRVSKSNLIIRDFNPDIYSINFLLKVGDIVRLSIISLLFFYLFVEVGTKIDEFKSNFLGTLSSNMLITVEMSIIFTINTYFKLTFFSQDKNNFYFPNKEKYIDTFWMGDYYNQIFFIESLQFVNISVKILDFLKMNDYIRLFQMSFDFGYVMFLKYSLIVIYIIINLSVVSHIIWGPFSMQFVSFSKALNNLLLFTVGKYDPASQIIYSGVYTLFFYILISFVMIFLMSNVFITLYIESLRNTVIRVGYPEDNNTNAWGLKEFYTWICYCFIEDEEDKILKRKKKRFFLRLN